MQRTDRTDLNPAYVRKRAVTTADAEDIVVNGRPYELDADGIAQTAHLALWRSRARQAVPGPETNAVTNAIVQWCHEYPDTPANQLRLADIGLPGVTTAEWVSALMPLLIGGWLTATPDGAPLALIPNEDI